LQDGEVLIHVAAVPINPIDFLKVRGEIENLQLPFTPGSECSGQIIDAKVSNPNWYLGRKCAAFCHNGACREYAIARAENVIIFADNVDYLDICGAFINPLTAIGLVETAILYNSLNVINNASGSALGKMICKVA